MLRKHIGEKVKGVHYGSSTEVRDPLTRMIETKPLKPFLVNQTVLMLERGQIRIPHLDTSEVLHRQMTNFQVVRISEKTQEPTYTDVDEHGLDAMIFAMYSFLEEYPDLVDIISENKLASGFGNITTYYSDPFSDIDLKTKTAFGSQASTDKESSKPRYRKVPLGYSKRGNSFSNPTNSLGWNNKTANKNIWKRPF